MFHRILRVASVLLLAGALLATAMLPGASVKAKPTAALVIDGSTTVYPIVSVAQWQFGGLPSETGTSFTITSTGSGNGQISILNGYVDIGMSSSACSQARAWQPVTPGFSTAYGALSTTVHSAYACPGNGTTTQPALTETKIGLDAIEIVINNARSAPCTKVITQNQILRIWQGGATTLAKPTGYAAQLYTWASMFGCTAADGAWYNDTILPYSRIVTSGTRASFATLLGVGTPGGNPPSWPTEEATFALTGLSTRANGNPDMLKDIIANADHIGYVSLAYQTGVTAIPLDCSTWNNANRPAGYTACTDSTTAGLGTQQTNVSFPAFANVKNLSYPMTRYLYLYTTPNASQVAKDFVNFITDAAGTPGTAGQGSAIVRNTGYVELIPDAQMPPNWDIVIDHTANITDVGVLGSYWNKTGPADTQDPEFTTTRGWTRADVNFDGVVNISDVSTFGAYWGGTW